MPDVEMFPGLTVFTELLITTPAVTATTPATARHHDDKHVALIGHVAAHGADTTLCHLSLHRLHRCPEVAFSPRPAGMQRCPTCLTAYALLPTPRAGN